MAGLIAGSPIISIISGLIIIALNVAVLTYINKLEKSNCPCAVHPYRKWIKIYTLIAIPVIAVFMFFPLIGNTITSPELALTLSAISFIFGVISLIFYFLSITYVRYLVKAKCVCSEEIRRSVLYWWAVIEILYIAIAIFLAILITLIGTSLGFVASQITNDGLKTIGDDLRTAAIDPVKSTKTFGSKVKNQFDRAVNYVNKAVKKVSKSKRS